MRFAALVTLTVLSLIFRLAAPQYLRLYIDTATAGESLDMLLHAASIYSLLSLGRHLCNIAQRILSERIGLAATDALRSDTAEHCLALDMSYHKERTAGEMISRLDHDINSISDFFANFWGGIVVSSLALTLALGVIIYESKSLGLTLTAATLISLFALLKVKDLTVPYLTALMPISATHYSTMEEHFAAGEDISGLGAAGFTFSRFRQNLAAWKTALRNAYLASNVMWGAMQLMFSLNTVITFIFCYIYWREGSMQVGTAFMLVIYSEQLRAPLNELRMRLSDLQKADAAINRLSETLSLKPGISDSGSEELPTAAPTLSFENVCFSYETGTDVLKNFNLTLEAGRVLGLVGRTGSGKSTLVRLIMRFYEPQQGKITLDGIPLAAFSLKDLRRSIAYVTQEVQLFRATVRDNLTFFDASISDVMIANALATLGLQDWLTELPQGLDSVLGDEFGLSAGESQLLALTRAFLRNPTIVILDEASARLDPITEKRLEQAIDSLLKGRTAIIIAHRTETLHKVDALLEIGG